MARHVSGTFAEPSPTLAPSPPPTLTLIIITELLIIIRYLCGAISYPRTESSAYPASFDVRAALAELKV